MPFLAHGTQHRASALVAVWLAVHLTDLDLNVRTSWNFNLCGHNNVYMDQYVYVHGYIPWKSVAIFSVTDHELCGRLLARDGVFSMCVQSGSSRGPVHCGC